MEKDKLKVIGALFPLICFIIFLATVHFVSEGIEQKERDELTDLLDEFVESECIDYCEFFDMELYKFYPERVLNGGSDTRYYCYCCLLDECKLQIFDYGK